MSRFIETICYENGVFQRIGLHNERCNRTRHHFFGLVPDLHLEMYLSVPQNLKDEIVKCTVTYGIEITNIEYQLYVIRPVRSLKVIYDDTIDYAFKYADRTKLTSLFKQKGEYDDVLIIKNGLITDTTYANTIFLRNSSWYSPDKPLLLGTRLRNYLNMGLVTPTPLLLRDLSLFSEIRLINAMIPIENSPRIPIENVIL